MAGDRRQCLKISSWNGNLTFNLFIRGINDCAQYFCFILFVCSIVCMCLCVSLCARERLCIRLAQIASQSIGPVVKLCLQSNSTYSMQFMPKNLHKSSDWPLVFSFISLALSQSMWKHSNGELIKKTVKKCVFASSGASLVFPIPLWMPCLFSKMCSLVFGERERKKERLESSSLFWFLELQIREATQCYYSSSITVQCAALCKTIHKNLFFAFFFLAVEDVYGTLQFFLLSIKVNEMQPTK